MNEERLAKVPRLRKEQGTEKDKMKERHMEGTRKVKGKCYEHHIDEDWGRGGVTTGNLQYIKEEEDGGRCYYTYSIQYVGPEDWEVLLHI